MTYPDYVVVTIPANDLYLALSPHRYALDKLREARIPILGFNTDGSPDIQAGVLEIDYDIVSRDRVFIWHGTGDQLLPAPEEEEEGPNGAD